MSDYNIIIEQEPNNINIAIDPDIDQTNISIDSSQAPVQSVNGKIGFVTIDKNDIDLSSLYPRSNPSGFITNENLNYIQGQIYSYSRISVLQNPGAPPWQQFYSLVWSPSWDGNITIPTNYKIVEYRLNNLEVKNPSAAPWETALTNINLPTFANNDTLIRIKARGITGVNNAWVLNIYNQTGILQTVDSTNPINRRYLEFIYTNNSWALNSPPYHLHSKSEISDLEPIIESLVSKFYQESLSSGNKAHNTVIAFNIQLELEKCKISIDLKELVKRVDVEILYVIYIYWVLPVKTPCSEPSGVTKATLGAGKVQFLFDL
jgi:hypothetical protein